MMVKECSFLHHVSIHSIRTSKVTIAQWSRAHGRRVMSSSPSSTIDPPCGEGLRHVKSVVVQRSSSGGVQ
ncbi:hypothetical protein TNCV_2166421 [Trichonephila clavipes]|nr:hypothetical protein TNCV_2166421 [Trichonephila clavipes]